MGAVAVNPAAGDVHTLRDRSRFANGVWRRWWLPQLACVAAANLGGIGLTVANRGRVLRQRGVAGTAAAKSVLLTSATAATLYGDVLGKRIDAAGPTPWRTAHPCAGYAARDRRRAQPGNWPCCSGPSRQCSAPPSSSTPDWASSSARPPWPGECCGVDGADLREPISGRSRCPQRGLRRASLQRAVGGSCRRASEEDVPGAGDTPGRVNDTVRALARRRPPPRRRARDLVDAVGAMFDDFMMKCSVRLLRRRSRSRGRRVAPGPTCRGPPSAR